ncbi:hypothetical protein RSSM_06023 [Rhodopirellula sallentina SM41]|uniref:Uncharacterized protein n=1 Tax=Rhodopirellula sallentina SM41 TaxID=1263870 RepID=M5U981_9BACT|nr:hypothetical protein RSSM_06023 [Rhodopirellula sallentina SM41]
MKFDESITLSLFKSQRVSEVVIPHGRIADVGPMRLKSFSNLSTLELKNFDSTYPDGSRIQCSKLRLTKITDDMLKGLEPNRTIENSDNHRMQRSGGGDDFTNGSSTPAAR